MAYITNGKNSHSTEERYGIKPFTAPDFDGDVMSMSVTPKLKGDRFIIGDLVRDTNHGRGKIKDIDPDDRMFHYNVDFEDGTGMWISDKWLSSSLS